MLATIRKWTIILLVLGAAGFLLYQGFRYRLQRDHLPVGTTIGEVDVSGLTLDEARSRLDERYFAPVYLVHREEQVELDPHNVGFVLDTDAMLAEAQQRIATQSEWLRFANYVLGRAVVAITVPLQATHDRVGLEGVLQSISQFLDEPAQAPQMLAYEEVIRDGHPGYITDIDASLPLAEAALYRPDNRVAQLVTIDQDAPAMSFDVLEEVINGKLATFDGLGSIFVMDLKTGEEIRINADVAMSGLSILKIAIFEEAYRALDAPPNAYQQQLFLDTATRSSNYGANLLLHIVAGEENTYRGADILTESMRRLGLVNTFMAVPYDANPPAYRQTTYVTPANSRTDINTEPDPTMQSTAEEIGTLLSMIYYCSKGGGPLLAVYPDQITPDECQQIIDLMVLNEEGNLIRYGVPEGTPVSHKHGWALATHADAGIVYSPGGDYVLVEYLNQPGEWLQADISFPVLREIARAAYNYFNMDEPYLGDRLAAGDSFDPNDPFSEGLNATPEATATTSPEESSATATPADASPTATQQTVTPTATQEGQPTPEAQPTSEPG
ncbi:MAG: serine hydrolase [Candidatus Promineifilaceae bacterium]